MLYIVLFLLGCYVFHYINSNKKNELADGEILLINDPTASSSQATETEIVI